MENNEPYHERMYNPRNLRKKSHRPPEKAKKKENKKDLSWIEIAVGKYLCELGYKPIYSKKFPDLVSLYNGSLLELDFYIREIGLVIEVQGSHHFRRVKTDKSYLDLERRKLNDLTKVLFCKKRGFELLTINYNEFEKYKKIIDEKIKSMDL